MIPHSRLFISAILLGVLFIIPVFLHFVPSPQAYGQSYTSPPSEMDSPAMHYTNTQENWLNPQNPKDTRLPKDPPEPEKPSFWQRLNPFRRKEKPPTDEEIMDVGPRTHPAAREPLLRLGKTLQLDKDTTLPPGFYLIRQQTVSAHQRLLVFYRGGQITAQIPAYSLSDKPAEPVESLDPEAPPTQLVSTSIVQNGHAMVIRFSEGEKRFESKPLVIVEDGRPVLHY